LETIMEISRSLKPAAITGIDATSGQRTQAAQSAGKRERQIAGAPQLSLETLQDNLRALPEVDLDKVEQIKQALQRGEITLDPEALAASMRAYHNGKDQ
jgi:negative regulator of flagellin synthesis FlgM